MTEILSDHSGAPSLKVTASLRTLNEPGECVLSAQFSPDESTVRSQCYRALETNQPNIP